MSEFNLCDDAAGSEPQPDHCTRRESVGEGTPRRGMKSASCLCGAFKLSFSSNITKTLICHCHSCRKETSSMFGTFVVVPQDSSFIVTSPFQDPHTTSGHHSPNDIRAHNRKVQSGNSVISHFCGSCGSIMYRISSGYTGLLFIPQGVVDDEELRDSKLEVEQWTCHRVLYLGGLPFTEKFEKNWYPEEKVERVGEGVRDGKMGGERQEEEIERVERVGEGVRDGKILVDGKEERVERVERAGEGLKVDGKPLFDDENEMLMLEVAEGREKIALYDDE